MKVSEKNWEKLTKFKLILRAKTLNEVIERILKIVSANEIKEEKKSE